MNPRRWLATVVAALFFTAALPLPGEAGAAPGTAEGRSAGKAATRPPHWAAKLDKAGLPNLHQVTTNLYRGGQPTAEGMAQLKAMGVKTVLNLRARHSDLDELLGTGMKNGQLHMNPWHAEQEEVARFLKTVADTNNLPVFVHCQRGADRTGMMCAVYRVVVGGWSKQEAIREMTQGGFGFNSMWKNLVRYVERMDVAALQRQAGVKPAQP